MNNLEKPFSQVQSIGQYSRRYFSYLSKVLQSIDGKDFAFADKREAISTGEQEK